jgi:hypothetical protein
MTHAIPVVLEAERLHASGLNASSVARRLGVPRSTVRDWLAGRAPRRSHPSACPRCGLDHAPLTELPPDYAYLLGLYLGDGCLSSHRRGVYKLRIFLDASYPRILDAAEESMLRVMPESSVCRVPKIGCFEIASYSKSWPCLFPQHGPGAKHTRPIILEPWQLDLVQEHPRLLLRGLIQSDGCRFINTGRNWRHPRYSFSNRSADIRDIFCHACDLLGLRWTTSPYTVYVSRKDDVALLDRFIGPKA